MDPIKKPLPDEAGAFAVSTAFDCIALRRVHRQLFNERFDAVTSALRSIVEFRRRYCDELQEGLTALHNLMDDGGAVKLGEAHQQLDHAVRGAYGRGRDLLNSPDKLLALLFDLNEACAQDSTYDPFGRLKDASAASLDLG